MDVLETLANQSKTDGHKMVQHSRRLVGELLAKYKEIDAAEAIERESVSTVSNWMKGFPNMVCAMVDLVADLENAQDL